MHSDNIVSCIKKLEEKVAQPHMKNFEIFIKLACYLVRYT
jgi:hypothetical protein